jgi:8-oxo-dGTP diphosphatase
MNMEKTQHDSEALAEGKQVFTACAFIFKKEGGVYKVFLPQRAAMKKFLPNIYELPGGHIDFGEELQGGLKREIREEFGVQVEVGKLVDVFTYTNHIKKSQSIEVVYFATLVSDESEITLNLEDHCGYVWATESEAMQINAQHGKGFDDKEVQVIQKGFELLKLKRVVQSVKKSYVYIDGANLHKGGLASGWQLDYSRLFVWLRERCKSDEVFLFIGHLADKQQEYDALRDIGYKLIFKEIARNRDGSVKGNCDSNLIVKALSDVMEYEVSSVVLVSSDGDFVPLVQFWKSKSIATTILSPYTRISLLLKRENQEIVLLPRLRSLLEVRNEKALDGDETP